MAWKRPFQVVVGNQIQTVTASPAGGWVMVSWTRQEAGVTSSPGSSTTESTVVSGIRRAVVQSAARASGTGRALEARVHGHVHGRVAGALAAEEPDGGLGLVQRQ